MVPDSTHLQQIFEHEETGFLSINTTTPKLFIDSSTISPFYSLSLAAKIVSQTHLTGHFLDAPVSGGVHGAKSATLTFMLGSPSELVDVVTPLLQKMGKNVYWWGQP